MPHSDWSGNEDQYDRYQNKKTKPDKKRMHPDSIENNDVGKQKVKKSKQKTYIERDYEKGTDRMKNKQKKHSIKYSDDVMEEKSKKKDSNNSATINIDSDSENFRNRKNKKEYKNKYSNNSNNVSEDELHRDKFENSDCDRDDHNRSAKSGKLDKSKNQPSHKRKCESESEHEKSKPFDPKKKHNKAKYKETSDNRKSPCEKSISSRSQFEDDIPYDRHDENSNNPDPDRSRSGSDKPFRYWSFSRGPIRKNSDSYWNKYSDRLKESNEHVEVGPRYYGSGENVRKEKLNDDSTKVNETDSGGKETLHKEVKKGIQETTLKQHKPFDPLTSRTGGAYIPPAKLKMMQESITDKGSVAYQRLAWEALKKSIQGHVNKVNISNIKIILKAVQKENIVRGRGLLCRALIQAQAASPSFTNVYAALIATLNCKFPRIGELLLKRLIVQFRRGFKRNDKTICITAVTFIAHLVNQEMAHEIVALEILTLLLENPTEDSVEVAIAFLKECGMKLTEVSSKGVMVVFDTLRNVLHEGKLEKRVQYMIEVMFQIRKEDFKAHPAVVDELKNILEEEDDDKILHLITLEDNHDPEDILNVFKFDPDYEANEAKYQALVADDSEDDEDDRSGSDSNDESEEEDEEVKEQKNDVIVDKTETNLVALRKTIYLTIQSSLDFEECAHKLLRMELKPGQEIEMAHMFLDCCSEQRTYEKFFGLLAQRFCQINRSYIGPFEETFRDSYDTIHRMSNDKLRNIAKLFAHLLFTDAISWDVLATIKLNEDDTNSSSRIFIKILFMELSEYMGLAKLNQRVKDPSLQTALQGLFPRDNPKHTRFAINFFTSIGLGGLTDELREHLKSQPKPSLMVPQLVEDLSSSSSSSSDSSDSSSDSSDSSSSSESSSSESEEDRSSTKRKKKKLLTKNKSQTSKKLEKEKQSNKKNKSSKLRKKQDS